MQKKKYSKLFYQYLFSYMLVFLIPLIILSVFISGYVLDILKDEIHTNNLNTLQNAKTVTESQLQYITSTEQKVYFNKMLGKFRIQETMKAVDAKEKLEAYCQLNPFLVDVAFYQKNSNYIIAASSSCIKEKFWDTMYSYEAWSYEDFLQDLETTDSFFFVKAQNVYVKGKYFQRLITLVIPLDATFDKCVIMLMDETFLTGCLPQVNYQQELSLIVDEAGGVLASSGKRELIVEERPNIEEENYDIVEIDGEKFLRSYVHSENFHWNYESYALLSSIETKVVHVRWSVILLCFLISVLETGAIMYFTWKNYSPLQILKTSTGNILENDEDMNEIDHIERVLNYLNCQNQQLVMNEKSRKEILKEQFVLKWVTGQYRDCNQLESMAKKVDIELNREKYLSAVLRIYKDKSEKSQKSMEILQSVLPKDVDILARIQADTAKSLIVLGYNQDKSTLIKDALSEFEKISEFEGCLAVGNPVDEAIRLKNSYAEALKALEYSIIMEERKIISYEETRSWKSNDEHDLNPGYLERCIKNRDEIALESFLNNFKAELKKRKLDIRLIRKLCNDLIYALEKTIANVNRDYFMDKPLYDNITGILEYNTVDELLDMIQLIANDIIVYLKNQSDQTIKEKMLVYIAENAFLADFSSTDLAEKLDMSVPYLSRYFKMHIGKNLSDYITELRIDKAKELLRYEDKSVKAVAEEVGYCSVNSFIRRFKQVSGYTPGEWKKMK